MNIFFLTPFSRLFKTNDFTASALPYIAVGLEKHRKFRNQIIHIYGSMGARRTKQIPSSMILIITRRNIEILETKSREG